MQPLQFRKRWASGWREETVLAGEWPDDAYMALLPPPSADVIYEGGKTVRFICANGDATYERLAPVGDLACLRKLKSFRDYTKDAAP